eukprot:1607803-Amphidinium_carterae.1
MSGAYMKLKGARWKTLLLIAASLTCYHPNFHEGMAAQKQNARIMSCMFTLAPRQIVDRTGFTTQHASLFRESSIMPGHHVEVALPQCMSERALFMHG